MALVITVRDIAADLQTVLRLLQVICLLKVSVNCYTYNTIFFRKCCHDPWPLLRSVRPKSVLAIVSVTLRKRLYQYPTEFFFFSRSTDLDTAYKSI